MQAVQARGVPRSDRPVKVLLSTHISTHMSTHFLPTHMPTQLSAHMPASMSTHKSAHSCFNCPLGKYCEGHGRMEPQQCPNGTTTKLQGRTEVNQCRCKADYFASYGEFGTDCNDCSKDLFSKWSKAHPMQCKGDHCSCSDNDQTWPPCPHYQTVSCKKTHNQCPCLAAMPTGFLKTDQDNNTFAAMGEYAYPADFGTSCKKWDIGLPPSCNTSNPRPWCQVPSLSPSL